MSLTPSNMLPLGSKAPTFDLTDSVSGKQFSLEQLKSDKATVIMFICNHCPYVKHIQHEIVKVAKQYQQKGIAFIAINSNDAVSHPNDAPDKMKQNAEQQGFTFPYLFDEKQTVAKAYQAACTPDFYIFDKKLACAYRGRFDQASPGNDKPVNGQDIRQALDNMLAGDPIDSDQHPSMGCNIKWK